MVKRKRLDDDQDEAIFKVKRIRNGPRYNLLDLSDELLIRILSYLTVKEVITAEQVSQRFRSLASDDSLWKSKFYDTFVRPRARRLPFSSVSKTPQTSYLSSKSLKWLEHGRLLRGDANTDWKRQYRISSNWAAGTARVQEMEIATPPAPPVLAKVHNGVLFTIDRIAGLRAWRQESGVYRMEGCIAVDIQVDPTVIAVDSNNDTISIVVGFLAGNLEVYEYRQKGIFQRLVSHAAGKDQMASVAIKMPYLLTISVDQCMRLHELKKEQTTTERNIIEHVMLRSESHLGPSALSLRVIGQSIIATVAYAFQQLTAGWCIGLQEIWLTDSGTICDSRLRSTVDTPLDAMKSRKTYSQVSSRSTFSTPFVAHPHMQHAPSSISYSHPYLMASVDSGLMVYIVTSDANKFEIHAGRRLWGHTSAISGTEMNDRGRAVSISTRGNEIRVWELENALTLSGYRSTSTQILPRHHTDGVTNAIANRGSGLGLAITELKKELATTRQWVGFDDEQVVILGQRNRKQIVSFYNFA